MGAAVLFDTAAELRPGHDQDFVAQPVALQILHEATERLIEVQQELVVHRFFPGVVVKASQRDVCDSHAQPRDDRLSHQLERAGDRTVARVGALRLVGGVRRLQRVRCLQRVLQRRVEKGAEGGRANALEG